MGAEWNVPVLGPALLAFTWMQMAVAIPIIGLAVLYFPARSPLLDRHPWVTPALWLITVPLAIIGALTTAHLLGAEMRGAGRRVAGVEAVGVQHLLGYRPRQQRRPRVRSRSALSPELGQGGALPHPDRAGDRCARDVRVRADDGGPSDRGQLSACDSGGRGRFTSGWKPSSCSPRSVSRTRSPCGVRCLRVLRCAREFSTRWPARRWGC